MRQVYDFFLRSLLQLDCDQIARVTPCNQQVFAQTRCHNARDCLSINRKVYLKELGVPEL